jgi:hypothetical protein
MGNRQQESMTKIRSIRVFSAAKVNALLYGILGLLLAPFFLLGSGLQMIGGGQRISGIAGLIFVCAVLPFIYAIFGFITGALMAFIYNAISRAIGGIEVELELPPPTTPKLTETPLPVPVIAAPSEVPLPYPPEVE